MTVIDKGSWPRRAHYDFFAPMSHPFYALTFPVDVTPLRALCKERGLSFYTAMVFAVIKAMEQVDAFLVRERDGVLVRHDALVPSFTDLKPDSDLFYIDSMRGLLPPGQGPSGGPDRIYHLRPLGAGFGGLFHLPALVPSDRPDQRTGPGPGRQHSPGVLGPLGGTGGKDGAQSESGAQPPAGGRGPCGQIL